MQADRETNAASNPRWKELKDEFLPFHPGASHIGPDYRDGWNACFKAAQAALAAPVPAAQTPPSSSPQRAGYSPQWPEDPTPAMLDALRTGSRKDWPSDELCRVRYAALRAVVGAVAGQAEDAARHPDEFTLEQYLAESDAEDAARWQPIETIGKSDDLVWLYDAEADAVGDTDTVVGPIPEWQAESRADSFTHWAPCKPPRAEAVQQAGQAEPGEAHD